MVNFRYHLVSLIAVFLALAVGICLGAGPLQNAISAALDGSGEARSIERLQEQVQEYAEQVDDQNQFVDSLAESALAGKLEGVSVATVALGDVSEETLTQISAYVTAAGGSVEANVELSQSWTSVSDRTYRDTLAASVTSYLSNDPVNATSAGVLAQALLEVLTLESSETDLLRDILVSERMPMVIEETLPDTPVQAVILLGSDTTSSGESAQSGAVTTDELSVVQPLWVALADTLATTAGGGVALGEAQEDTDFITVLRDGGSTITTVDGINTRQGIYNAVAALVVIDGKAYGTGLGAETAAVPITY